MTTLCKIMVSISTRSGFDDHHILPQYGFFLFRQHRSTS